MKKENLSRMRLPLDIIPGQWESQVPKTRVSWVAWVEHRDLEASAWVRDRLMPVGEPVVIRAEMYYGAPLTKVEMSATVTHEGHSWSVLMFDDGLHGDGIAHDGEYAGIFNEDGTSPNVDSGLYRVKVRMTSTAGQSLALELEEFDDDINEPRKRFAPGDAVVEAETSFRLSSRYTLDPNGNPNPGGVVTSCPDLLRGQTYSSLTAEVSGLALDLDDTRLSLGPGITIAITGTECGRCEETVNDPTTVITFDAIVGSDAETGPRDLKSQAGRIIFTDASACTVCTQPGVEFCNGRDDDCNGLVDEDATGAEDSDDDGIFNVCDNCPYTRNPAQDDFDDDGTGDLCDEDDGVIQLRFVAAQDLDWQAEGWRCLRHQGRQHRR